MFAMPVAGTLPASKTFAARRWTFVPAADLTQPGVGVLTLVQGRRDCDSYGVAVDGDEVLFAKLDDAGDVYAVSLDRYGRPASCSCPGHFFARKRGGSCKHLDAARELVADGIICTLPAAA